MIGAFAFVYALASVLCLSMSTMHKYSLFQTLHPAQLWPDGGRDRGEDRAGGDRARVEDVPQPEQADDERGREVADVGAVHEEEGGHGEGRAEDPHDDPPHAHQVGLGAEDVREHGAERAEDQEGEGVRGDKENDFQLLTCFKTFTKCVTSLILVGTSIFCSLCIEIFPKTKFEEWYAVFPTVAVLLLPVRY